MAARGSSSSAGLVQARESFVTSLAGQRISVVKGDLFAESDPLVKAVRGKFEDPSVRESGVTQRAVSQYSRAQAEPKSEATPDASAEEESSAESVGEQEG